MTEISCVADIRAQLGEGPCWDPVRRRLYWFDIRNRRLFAWEAGGATLEWTLPARASAAAPLADGAGLLISSEEGLWRFDDRTGACMLIEPAPEQAPGFRSNDGKADQAGGLWWSLMDDDGGKRPGSVWRFDGVRSTPMVRDIHIANCLAFSPDGATLYLSDTARRTIWAFDFDAANGTLANRRVFAEFTGGGPVGAAMDAEGHLWVAIWGGWRVDRFRPDGRVVRSVAMPVEQPSSCAFGGPSLDILYVTSAWEGQSAEARLDQPLSGGLFA
ncbi:MAG: putative gluconolactonase protein, partial [Caulobacteraceae bacterium]|nr:putative gluconolactonase protein [Caulobacteraceae bacterium]